MVEGIDVTGQSLLSRPRQAVKKQDRNEFKDTAIKFLLNQADNYFTTRYDDWFKSESVKAASRALKKQAGKVWHVSNAFLIPEGEKLASRLKRLTFADNVLFQNSGAEATEAAIKVARRYFFSIGKPYKNRILCIKNSFHGRTIAAIYASGSKKMTEGFGPKPSVIFLLPLAYIAAIVRP